MFKLPDGSLRLIVQGLARLQLDEVVSAQAVPARARQRRARGVARRADRLEIDALQRNIKTNFQQVVSLSPLLSDDLQTLAPTSPTRAGWRISSPRASRRCHAVKQEVLETLDVRARMDAEPHPDQGARGPRAGLEDPVAGAVGGRQEPARVLPARAAQGHPEGARRRRRPGQGDRGAAEKIDAAGMPEPVKKEALRELDRLPRCRRGGGVHGSRTYLDWLVALPWQKRPTR
jgi:ATP-dependent Lon protease